MYCHTCGAQIPEHSVFCPKCGTKIAILQAMPMENENNTNNKTHSEAPSSKSSRGKAEFWGTLILILILGLIPILGGRERILAWFQSRVIQTATPTTTPSPSASPSIKMVTVITGFVRDKNYKTVSDARVILSGIGETNTDNNGLFRFELKEPVAATTRLRASASKNGLEGEADILPSDTQNAIIITQ